MMRTINKVIVNANVQIENIEYSVTRHLIRILVHAGIPSEIANKYYAQNVNGVEWILGSDSDRELLCQDIQLLSDEYVISVVRELEGLN